MYLAIFDIDGTLTMGDGLGTRCFFDAVEAEFGVTEHRRDWRDYRHVTDEGIASEIFERAYGRGAGRQEIARLRDRYLTMLGREIRASFRSYVGVPGALAVLEHIATLPDWQVAIATGNWAGAALLKLGAAGLPFERSLLASSDDSTSRNGILCSAVERAESYGGGPPRHVVSVGDGEWDRRAAAALGVGFVRVDARWGGGRRGGVEAGQRRHGAGEGAGDLLPDLEDYSDLDATMEVLAGAARPWPTEGERGRDRLLRGRRLSRLPCAGPVRSCRGPG